MIFSSEQHHAVFRYCMMLFCFGLPLHPRIASLALVIALINEILAGNWKEKIKGLAHPVAIASFLFYALFLFGLAYSENQTSALSSLETKLPFLVCPLLFFTRSSFEDDFFKRLLKFFILGCAAAAIFCLGSAVFTLLQTGTSTFFYKSLSEHIGGHPTYLAMYTGLALFGLLHQCWKERITWVNLGLILLFSVFLILLSARMELLTIFFLLALSLLIGMYRKGQLFKGLIFIGVGMLLLGLIVWNVPTTKSRFQRAIASIINPGTGSDGNIRWRIWDSASDILSTDNNWILGLGTGDTQIVLDKSYQNKGYISAFESHLNAHNQYIQILLAIGVVGLLAWLYLLALGVKWRPKNDPMLIWFIALFALSCLTESMLESQRGTLFFCFFFFLLLGIQKNEKN